MKPREKLQINWPRNLESWELIAVILGTGTKGQNVFQVARKASKVIASKQDRVTLDDLLTVKWIWKVKGMQIISGFELARRHYIPDEVSIQSSADVVSQVWEYRAKQQEYLLTLTLDGAGKLINKRVITIWILDESLAHPREIFTWAIADRAHSMILVHNHPSWNVRPSSADMRTTNRICEVWKLVGIQVRDHVIIWKNDHYSFRENALI